MAAMSIILKPEQLEEITGHKTKTKQAAELRRLGIEYKIRADGFPIVSRLAFERAMGGVAPNEAHEWEPDFSALDRL